MRLNKRFSKWNRNVFDQEEWGVGASSRRTMGVYLLGFSW